MCVLSFNMASFRIVATRILWKGVHLSPAPCLLTHCAQTPVQFSRLSAAQHRPLYLSLVSSMSSSRPVQEKIKQDPKATEEEEDEEEEGPEYIPKRKAKNPMIKIGYAWMIGLPTGILTFILAKRQVDKNRLKQLKIRQRMRQSNEGEFEGSRYQRHTGT